MPRQGKNGPRAPKPTPKARAKKASVRRGIRTRLPPGLSLPPTGHIYDPAYPADVPTVFYEGQATSVTVKGQDTASTNVGVDVILCVHNTGCTATVAWLITNAVAPFSNTINAAQMTGSATAGGPTSARAMKCGVCVRNYTQLLNVAGRVHVLVTNRRVELPGAPTTMNQAQVNTLRDELINHPDTLMYTGKDMVGGKCFYATPHDQTDYLNYDTWRGTVNVDEQARFQCAWPGATRELMPMTAIWIVLRSTAATATNDYQISVMNKYYTRWPLDQVMSTLHRDVPTAPAAFLNKQRAAAEKLGANGEGAPHGGLSGYIMDGARAAGSAIYESGLLGVAARGLGRAVNAWRGGGRAAAVGAATVLPAISLL